MTLRRDRRRGTKRSPAPARIASKCLNCGHPGAHYVPPSFGDSGFFACKSFCDDCRPGPDDRSPR